MDNKNKICFATSNIGKLNEIRLQNKNSIEILGLDDIGCKEEIPEVKETIEENSADKALYVFKNYNIKCFADDSGLEVEALNGSPGVHSAIYAGLHRSNEDNIKLLLKNMLGVTNRSAQFKTVLSYVDQNEFKQFEGIVKGKIIEKCIGNNGFGYDCIFIPDGYDITYAQMSDEQKIKISSRAIAFDKFYSFFKNH